jgi:FKBP-type peptidyl-prolyl cis-trans isomerase SlyD
MHVGRGKVVAIEYTLKNEQGKVLQEVGSEPVYYLHGYKNVVPGLEEALTGLKAGDTFNTVLPPERGFGKRDERLVFAVPFGELPPEVTPQKGRRLQVQIGGMTRPATIVKVRLKDVLVDANHELADQTVQYSGVVKQVREATRTELNHGHAHSPDHDHH